MVEPLPNELIESIIENLYSDRTTLLSCALVGRAWVHSSQRGIFRQILLWLPPQQHKTKVIDDYIKLTGQLIASFDANSILATYVQSLELRWILRSYEDRMHTATSTIIHRLPNVKELSFYAIHWGFLPPFLRASLAGLFQSPSLTRISFSASYMSSCIELASILSHAKYLKILDVSIRFYNNVTAFLESKPEKTSHTPHSIQLSEMTLDVDPRFMTWFQMDWCPFEVRNLKMLSLNSLDFSIDIGLVKLAGRCLRELRLTCLKLSNMNNYLEYTPNLNILYIGLSNEQSHSNHVAMIQEIFKPVLNQNQKRFPLHYLTIEVYLEHRDHFLGSNNFLDPWTAIDTLFRSPELGLLETVQLDLVSNSRIIPSGFEESFRRNLPFLEESRKLVVNI